MPFDPAVHHRRSIRLRGYNYSRCGAYFVTLCAVGGRRDAPHLYGPTTRFGEIVDGKMRLNEFGELIEVCWKWLPQRYTYVELDAWIVMPNHLHGIIVITRSQGGSRAAPTGTKTLGGLVGVFKTVSTRRLNELRNTPGARVWQRNYYERVIRNNVELDKIREYISTNPLRWPSDPENL